MQVDRPAVYRPRKPRASPFWQCVSRHLAGLRASGRMRLAERERPEIEEPDVESASKARQAAKVAGAKLIRKVYEVDPLLCPKCGAPMRVIAPIEDPTVIERILSWLGLWEPRPPGGPSLPPAAPSLPLMYHPVPAIA